MKEMYFSVPCGTNELSFGITGIDNDELWKFSLIFIESTTMNSRLVLVYGDYKEDGSIESQTAICDRHKDYSNEFEFEFNVSETKKVNIYLCMTNEQYITHVRY